MRKGEKMSDSEKKRRSETLKGKNLGAKRTPEQNKRRSEDYKAKGIKPPSRKGIDPWNKGKIGIYSDETIKAISKSVSKHLKENPIVFTEEVRKKIGDAHRGEKCSFWRGGLYQDNRSERKKITETYEYKKWRRDIFKRDDFNCQLCPSRGGRMRAHHIKRFVDYPELRLDLRNGITICEDCDNSKVLHREKAWEVFLFSNLFKRGIINEGELTMLIEFQKTKKNG